MLPDKLRSLSTKDQANIISYLCAQNPRLLLGIVFLVVGGGATQVSSQPLFESNVQLRDLRDQLGRNDSPTSCQLQEHDYLTNRRSKAGIVFAAGLSVSVVGGIISAKNLTRVLPARLPQRYPHNIPESARPKTKKGPKRRL